MYVSRNTEARSRIIVAVEKPYVLLTRMCVHACGYSGAWAWACA